LEGAAEYFWAMFISPFTARMTALCRTLGEIEWELRWANDDHQSSWEHTNTGADFDKELSVARAMIAK